MNIKKEISWFEANTMLHSFASLLDEESRNRFYDAVQNARNSDDPKKVVQSVIAHIIESNNGN